MTIKHVVVVMLENRSFDNVLSALNGTPPTHTNEGPAGSVATHGAAAKRIGTSGATYAGTTLPLIDPGEKFSDMAQQFLNVTAGDDPYDNYDSNAPMSGFVNDYAAQKTVKVPIENLSDVMAYLTPEQLPVTSFLARNYGVCERWFASAPTQTYANRAFALTAAPSVHASALKTYSLIEDPEYYIPGVDPIEMPSLPALLDTEMPKKPNPVPAPYWKVYFHDYSIAEKTVPYVANKAADPNNINVARYDDCDWGPTNPSTFVEDVTHGTLPPFSFIEPRYFDNCATNHLPPNSNHPGASNQLTTKEIIEGGKNPVTPTNPPIDVATSEAFLMDVYNRLRSSDLWPDTLLIITYDEHGGTYDSVPPPSANPPGTINWNGTKPKHAPNSVPPCSDFDKSADGFEFTVYGGRVPAIIVSAYTAPGPITVPAADKPPFEHASIVRTVRDIFNLGDPLNDRDANAPSLVVSLRSKNETEKISGIIVAGPRSPVLTYSNGVVAPSSATRIFANAGRNAGQNVPIVPSTNEPWLTASISELSDQLVQLAIVADKLPQGSGPFTASVILNASACAPLMIPVTLTLT